MLPRKTLKHKNPHKKLKSNKTPEDDFTKHLTNGMTGIMKFHVVLAGPHV